MTTEAQTEKPSNPTTDTTIAPSGEAAAIGEPRVRVTERAAEYMKTKLMFKGKPGAALRIGVKGGGCNGLTYVTDITEEPPRKRDLVYDFHGLKVYVDNRSIRYIEGCIVDYEQSLMYQGLRFKNPLEATSCGCGETFSVDESVMKGAR